MKTPSQQAETDPLELAIKREMCERSHLFFTRYFFKARQNITFRVNWHHRLMSDVVDDVIAGRLKNVVITVSPGSSKTEIIVINLLSRGLAKNPHARFLHLSGSDSLALLNSATARDIVRSDEYQALWPMQIADDSDSKKRWNVMYEGRIAGGVYATSLGGQVTGFRAGHMAPGFQGAIVIDDPIKVEDSFSPQKLKVARRRLISTVKSRRASPDTPIILVMQRISDLDPVDLILKGGLGKDWTHINIPALIDDQYVSTIDPKYHASIVRDERDEKGRFSYWPYKEPLASLLEMEAGGAADQDGNVISRHVFSSQYQQSPKAIGGNILKGADFVRYTIAPKIKWRRIYGDTAQKTKEANDYSVLACWGLGEDGKMYLLDILRGKWESPELRRRTRAFYAKHSAQDAEKFGRLRGILVEDKSSGTDLIQTLRVGDREHDPIPIEGIERSKDKFTRVQDALPYIESKMVCVPESAPFTNDFIEEHEAFTADDSHAHDDQVDCTMDAVMDMLSNGNKLNTWERLGNKNA